MTGYSLEVRRIAVDHARSLLMRHIVRQCCNDRYQFRIHVDHFEGPDAPALGPLAEMFSYARPM